MKTEFDKILEESGLRERKNLKLNIGLVEGQEKVLDTEEEESREGEKRRRGEDERRRGGEEETMLTAAAHAQHMNMD